MNARRSLRRYRLAASLAASSLVIAGLLLAGTGAGARVATAPLSPTPYRLASSPIQHVVVLMMENHSFDSVFGFWRNQNPGRCPDGGMPSSVTLSNGAVVKPSVDPDVVPIVGSPSRTSG
jgi:phospholipase C